MKASLILTLLKLCYSLLNDIEDSTAKHFKYSEKNFFACRVNVSHLKDIKVLRSTNKKIYSLKEFEQKLFVNGVHVSSQRAVILYYVLINNSHILMVVLFL